MSAPTPPVPSKVISLAHIKVSAPVVAPPPAPKRIAWTGGDMVTNKAEALRKFIERKGGVDKLTPQQKALITVAATSHTKLAVPVQIVATAEIAHSPALAPVPAPVAIPCNVRLGMSAARRASAPAPKRKAPNAQVAARIVEEVEEEEDVPAPAKRRVVLGPHPSEAAAARRVSLAAPSAAAPPPARKVTLAKPKQKAVVRAPPHAGSPSISLQDKLDLPLQHAVKRR